MKLESLIEEFRLLEKDLETLIDSGSDLHCIQGLDGNITEIAHKISDYRPTSVNCLREKLSFFLKLMARNREDLGNSLALDALISMLNRDLDDQYLEALVMNSPTASETSSVEAGSGNNTAFKEMSAYDLVNKSKDRISIIDREYRYVNTSHRNGRFYKQNSSEMVGKHVGDVIGEWRFESRARRFFEKTFSGGRQQYFHSLETAEGMRIMACQMSPLYSAENQVKGAMVAMSDITNLVANKDSVILENVE